MSQSKLYLKPLFNRFYLDPTHARAHKTTIEEFGRDIVALHKKDIKYLYYFFREFMKSVIKKRGWNQNQIAPQVSESAQEIDPAALPDSTRKTFKNNRR